MKKHYTHRMCYALPSDILLSRMPYYFYMVSEVNYSALSILPQLVADLLLQILPQLWAAFQSAITITESQHVLQINLWERKQFRKNAFKSELGLLYKRCILFRSKPHLRNNLAERMVKLKHFNINTTRSFYCISFIRIHDHCKFFQSHRKAYGISSYISDCIPQFNAIVRIGQSTFLVGLWQ